MQKLILIYFRILSFFNRNVVNIIAFLGENTSTYRACSSKMAGPIFVGCHIHGFNLAVKDLLKEQQEVTKKSLNFHEKAFFDSFSVATSSNAIIGKPANSTRWSSTK